jgi:hypothetical protein
MQIGLVSCTKSKRDEPAPPGELYTESALFRKARAYCEQYHDDWYVLSAKHHLLDPAGPPIEPYDETLSGARVETKRAWAQAVFEQLRTHELLTDDVTLVVHAGRDYYDELLPQLAETPVEVRIPTEGLQFGETLAWYNEHLETMT